MAGHWKRPCLLENGELACLSEMLKKTRPKSFARRLLHMNSRRHSADGAERRRVGGQPFLISDLAPSVGDGMERRGGREGGKPWVLANGSWRMAAMVGNLVWGSLSVLFILLSLLSVCLCVPPQLSLRPRPRVRHCRRRSYKRGNSNRVRRYVTCWVAT